MWVFCLFVITVRTHYRGQKNIFTDDRTREWFMTSSPIPPLLLIFIYFKFVKRIGPDFMQFRNPFKIDRIVQIYNLIQIFLCAWMAYTSYNVTYGSNGYYNWTCQPIDTSLSPAAKRTAKITWIYYMIKIFDLMDTLFFVLRKKFNQITTLHVYHHGAMIVLGYMATKYYPDGQGFLLVPLNSLVHTIMYFYYFITNYKPEYKKKIWWKKYITQMQIAQFLFLLIHIGKVLFSPSCSYPKFPVILFVPQNILVSYLFAKFYVEAYVQPSKDKKT